MPGLLCAKASNPVGHQQTGKYGDVLPSRVMKSSFGTGSYLVLI